MISSYQNGMRYDFFIGLKSILDKSERKNKSSQIEVIKGLRMIHQGIIHLLGIPLYLFLMENKHSDAMTNTNSTLKNKQTQIRLWICSTFGFVSLVAQSQIYCQFFSRFCDKVIRFTENSATSKVRVW